MKRLNWILPMLAMAASAPSPPSRRYSLRPSDETTEAARLGEFGPDVPAANRKSGDKRKRANARKARRGWR